MEFLLLIFPKHSTAINAVSSASLSLQTTNLELKNAVHDHKSIDLHSFTVAKIMHTKIKKALGTEPMAGSINIL